MKKITYIQLRAARQLLGIGVRELGALLKVSKSTISTAEANSTRDFYFKYSAALIDFFETKNITFPTEFSIRYNPTENLQEQVKDSELKLTKFQLRTARYILNISQLELANILGFSRSLISHAELLNNTAFINFSNPENIIKLKVFFLQQNIEFIDPFYIFYKNYVDNGSIRW